MSSNFMNAFAGTRLYAITDRHLSRLSHADQVAHLSECGATVVQLREKIDPPLRFYREAEAAVRVARERGVRIIINDRVDIALALKADGVHLGQEDMPPVAARRIFGRNAIIGFSTHNLKQAISAVQMPVDYIALGPIFATATKKSSSDVHVGIEGLKLVREAVGAFPLVAIGGITAENVGPVLSAGADLVAVISDIWSPAEHSGSKISRLLNAS